MLYICYRLACSRLRPTAACLHHKPQVNVQRMAAAQLRFLRVGAVQLGADRVEQLQVALVRPSVPDGDERPAEGASSLSVLEGIGSVD